MLPRSCDSLPLGQLKQAVLALPVLKVFFCTSKGDRAAEWANWLEILAEAKKAVYRHSCMRESWHMS